MLGLLGTLSLCAGCRGTVTPKKETEDKENRFVEQDSLTTATELLHKTATLDRCQESLRLINAHLNNHPDTKARLKLDTEQADVLRERYHLAPDELEYVALPGLQPLDAHHLELCYRLRDAADSLRVQSLPPVQRARAGFDWVMRQVVLDSSDDYLFPPSVTLRRGRGTAEERATVFLALLPQLNLTGCMIAVPKAKGEGKQHWLVGVVVPAAEQKDGQEEQSKGVYLFDPRLGLPLPGPGGEGIATLEQLKKQPDLVKPLTVDEKFTYDVTPEQAAKAEVQVVVSLTALSPRMAWLEQEVNQQDHVALTALPQSLWEKPGRDATAPTPQQLLQFFEAATGGPVQVWNAPAEQKSLPRSPLRALRTFIPRDQGGVAAPELYGYVVRQLAPWSAVIEQYRQWGLQEELPASAFAQLLTMDERLFEHYLVEPRDRITRGRLDDILKPLDRMRTALDAIQAASLKEGEFEQKLAQWKQRVRSLYLEAGQGQAQAQTELNRVWSEDQFLLFLLMPGNEDQELPRHLQPGILSFLVLKAANQPVRERQNYLLAQYWREKAERFEQQVRELQTAHRKPSKDLRQQASNAWGNAVDWSGSYIAAAPLTPGAIESQLQHLQRRWQVASLDIQALEQFFRQLHLSAAMQLLHAEALEQSGQSRQAQQSRQQLQQNLQTLLASEELQQQLKDFQKRTEQLDGALRSALEQRVEQFRGTLQPGGSLHWMACTAALQGQKAGAQK
jgi:hypothetical protein